MRRNRPSRRWESHDENDPLAGLVNLFDLWMVFSIAILDRLRRSARRSGGGAPSRERFARQSTCPRRRPSSNIGSARRSLKGRAKSSAPPTGWPPAKSSVIPDAESDSKSDQHAPSESR